MVGSDIRGPMNKGVELILSLLKKFFLMHLGFLLRKSTHSIRI